MANQATARDGRGIRPPSEGREEAEGLNRHRALSEVRTRLESPGTEAQAQFTGQKPQLLHVGVPQDQSPKDSGGMVRAI